MNLLGPGGFKGTPTTGGPPLNTGGPPNLNNAPNAPTGGAPGLQLPGGAPGGPFAPPRPGLEPQVRAQLPGGTFFQPGTTLFAQVASKAADGMYSLRTQEHTLKAKSNTPLTVGQSIQLKVRGETEGILDLQILKTPFTKRETSDLANTLAKMNLPANEQNVELAKTMVEKGIPLTKENFKELLSQTALPDAAGKTPPPMPARVAAVAFLQQNNIPATPQNVATLSNFMAANPHIGQQMAQLNGALDKLNRQIDSRALDLLRELPGIAAENGGLTGPRKKDAPPQPPPRRLFNMAREAGIEGNLGGYSSGDDPWELVAEMRRFREEHAGAGDEGMQKLLELMGDIEQNFEAHRLINQAYPDASIGYYYLQLPIAQGMEVWVQYYKDYDGNKIVDKDDARIEFLVNTDEMGELFFAVEIKQGHVSVEVGSAIEDVREFVNRYLPLLKDRIENLGWKVYSIQTVYRPHTGGRELVEHTDFEEIQGFDVQA